MGRERRQFIIDFFDRSFLWWEDVYEQQLPRGFFSFEMIRRKEAVLQLIDSFLQRKGSPLRILECGCGPGGLLRELPSGKHLVYGLDINQRSLHWLKPKCEGASLVCGDIERLPFAPGSFDLILCIGVLSYLTEDEQAVKEMAGLLKTGGQMLLANPNLFMIDKLADPYYLLIWPFKRLKQSLSPTNDTDRRFTTCMIRRYRYGQLDRLFQDAGLIRTGLIGTSYGPLRFWRRECFSTIRAMRFSDAMVRFSTRPAFGFLPRMANHWVTCLEKSV